jgi:hypothetical protein
VEFEASQRLSLHARGIVTPMGRNRPFGGFGEPRRNDVKAGRVEPGAAEPHALKLSVQASACYSLRTVRSTN